MIIERAVGRANMGKFHGFVGGNASWVEIVRGLFKANFLEAFESFFFKLWKLHKIFNVN